MSTTGTEAAIRTALHEALTAYHATSSAAADHALAVYSCSLAAHVVLRHDPHAVALVIEEGDYPNWRSARGVVSVDGTVRPLTDDDDEDEDVEDADAVHNLVDGNAAAWRPLCSRFDRRHGVYHLDLVKARDAGTSLLAK
ncbi:MULTISPECIES: hypothetical protein [unclassified Streptomyces]|uniref:hypothetical protein n=1 Tax=unclassified Streptomyces TaxID=2593676 RepID=UPI00081E8C25|nr:MULTISPECIES: hypothetical protein [unclassified Streptomyces]MYZ35030.1 hypothetical protein [Streptomyces sp. SID4917]SCF72236.1 hypothetical protein GA0115259_101544 [Streptomyces sp. MnatMP-M17]